MRLISWNVAARKRQQPSQLQRLIEADAEVIALQEVTEGTCVTWRQGLAEAGYGVCDTAGLLAAPYPPPPYPELMRARRPIVRTKFNLVATRLPIEAAAGLTFPDSTERRLAFPEKFLAARIRLGKDWLHVYNAHLPPGSSRGFVKVHAFEAIRRRMDEDGGRPRVLCGDFNSPIRELPGGEIYTGARRWHDGGMRPKRGKRWDGAELSILRHPELRDAYLTHRDRRGAEGPMPASHFTRGSPRRYDHVFVSSHFEVKDCHYRTDWLEEGLSDHAAVVADLDLQRWQGPPAGDDARPATRLTN